MADSKFLSAPDPNQTGWPKGVPYIIGNEGCERFSFYGMKAILQIHLTMLFVGQGLLDDAAGDNAQEMVHLFVAGVYAFPMIGAIIADRLFGKYKTILLLSLVYCLGHAVLAVGENSIGGMWLGLALIAIGSGGIKPCVSAHVGDQFGKGNWHLVGKVFQAFYFIINFGSFFSTVLIPYTREEFGASVAFGIAGVLMFIATVMFWMGRNVFVHVPPNPGGRTGALDAACSTLLFMGFFGLPMFLWSVLPDYAYWPLTFWSIITGLWIFEERQLIKEDDGFLAIMLHSLRALFNGDNVRVRREEMNRAERGSPLRNVFFSSSARKFGVEAAEGPLAVLRIISVFLLVSIFWALFDQHASSWVRQAAMMDLDLNIFSKKISLLPSQISALNPLMVMALIPFNNFWLYPTVEKMGFSMSPLRRMAIGNFVASLAFVTVALIQVAIVESPESKVSILWQIVPYLIMTQAEVMVSITGLEFAYTQAPVKMKSTIMGFWLLSVSLGNILTAKLTVITAALGWSLTGFFWLFAGLMAVAAVLFGLISTVYRYRDYSQ